MRLKFASVHFLINAWHIDKQMLNANVVQKFYGVTQQVRRVGVAVVHSQLPCSIAKGPDNDCLRFGITQQGRKLLTADDKITVIKLIGQYRDYLSKKKETLK